MIKKKRTWQDWLRIAEARVIDPEWDNDQAYLDRVVREIEHTGRFVSGIGAELRAPPLSIHEQRIRLKQVSQELKAVWATKIKRTRTSLKRTAGALGAALTRRELMNPGTRWELVNGVPKFIAAKKGQRIAEEKWQRIIQEKWQRKKALEKQQRIAEEKLQRIIQEKWQRKAQDKRQRIEKEQHQALEKQREAQWKDTKRERQQTAKETLKRLREEKRERRRQLKRR